MESKFVRGDMLVSFMIEEGVIPVGSQNVKIEGNIDSSPLLVTCTFIATEEDAKIIMGYDYVNRYNI